MSQGLLVEGALNNLKVSTIALKEPVKYLPDQRQFVDKLGKLETAEGGGRSKKYWGVADQDEQNSSTFIGVNFRYSEFGHDGIKQSQPPLTAQAL